MKNKFNFNIVVDLYREGREIEGCEYLYNNIDVFLKGCKQVVIGSNDYHDIVGEAILEGHESILKSLDNSYGQIYNYVRTRIVGRVKNYFIKMYRYDKNFHVNSMRDLDEEDGEDSIDITDNTVLKLIIDGILSLSLKDREIIYLRIFNYPGKTWQEISELSGVSVRALSSRYVKSIKKIKKYLASNGFVYENLF